MTTNEILHHKKYLDYVQYEIDEYNNRPPLEPGRRWKRTPVDSLKEKGIFTPVGLTAAFCDIAKHESDLTSAQRKAVTAYCLQAIQTFKMWQKKNEAKAEALKNLKSPCEDCTKTGIGRDCLDDLGHCRDYVEYLSKKEALKPDPEWQPETQKQEGKEESSHE